MLDGKIIYENRAYALEANGERMWIVGVYRRGNVSSNAKLVRDYVLKIKNIRRYKQCKHKI